MSITVLSPLLEIRPGAIEMLLYAFGSNASGQLGIGHAEDVHDPRLCPNLAVETASEQTGLPLKIAAGGNLTYLLFDDGGLYQAGRGMSSHEKQQVWSSTTFDRLHCTGFREIKLCALNWDAAVSVTEASDVYVEGSGPAGELALGSGVKYCAEARKLPGFPPGGTKVVDIASSVSHTVIILSNGEAWGWGNGRKGQLGKPAEVVWQARKITGVEFEVVRAVCGREFTFLVSDPSLGRHVILGSDKWGIKSKAPNAIHNWKDIAASWGSLFVLDNAGLVKSWGRNDRGQLAPSGLPPIAKLAAGSEHVLVLTTEGKIFAWGWGEHGNCGAYTDEEGNVSGIWNEIHIDDLPASSKVLGISAGCATSFVWSS